MRIPAVASLVTLLFTGTAASRSAILPVTNALDQISANDNTRAAGTLRAGVLTVKLEVRAGAWRPDGNKDPGVDVLAFGEEGRVLEVPGPLIRVPEGTEIRASIRNHANATVTVHGLYSRGPSSGSDTVQIASGGTRDVAFAASVEGTFYYWASTTNATITARTGPESLLGGALVVDPRGSAGPAKDRIFVLGLWGDSLGAGLLPITRARLRYSMNGKSWPHTERLEYAQGDTIRWRVINLNAAVHPMHLHGFYFHVNSRGDERVDSILAPGTAPDLAVTERLAPGRTTTLSWVAERPGNWLYHCHDNVHIQKQLPIDPVLAKASTPAHAMNHATDMMAGLVLGVHVRPAAGTRPAARAVAPRHLRLIAGESSGGTAGEPSYGFALQEKPGTGSVDPVLPGPPIVLKRGEPVRITVVNRLPETTAVHWHGIELESYFDGVADFAGAPGRIAPAIAPHDSFEVRFTPPRAGTFIYHTHVDEVRQQRAGLAGALIVIDPQATYDPKTDIVLLVSTPRNVADNGTVLLNGSMQPARLELQAGVRYRLRIINIHIYRPSMRLEIRKGAEVLEWRPVAKDGADLPAERAVTRRASMQMGNGETYDFEFAPREAGELMLHIVTGVGVPLTTMPIRVH